MSNRTRQGQLHANYRKVDNKSGFDSKLTASTEDILTIISQPCCFCSVEKSGGCRRLDNKGPHVVENLKPCCLSCNRKGATVTDAALTLKATFEAFKSKYNGTKLPTENQQTGGEFGPVTKLPTKTVPNYPPLPREAGTKLPTKTKLPTATSYIIKEGGERDQTYVLNQRGVAKPHPISSSLDSDLTRTSRLIAAQVDETEEQKKEEPAPVPVPAQEQTEQTEEEQPPVYQGLDSEQPVPDKWLHLWAAARTQKELAEKLESPEPSHGAVRDDGCMYFAHQHCDWLPKAGWIQKARWINLDRARLARLARLA